MTRIDFYVLDQAEPQGRERFACRLAEKAYKLGNKVFIHTTDEQQAQAVDDLLWSFRAGSFVPHSRRPEDAATAPVMIAAAGEPEQTTDVLINLADEVPLFFSRFLRVAEVVDGQDEVRRAGRERFKFYRERGYDLESHPIHSSR